nr:MAG TPA: DNA-binding regulatory protein [Caudoviricetes sp.]
MHEDKSTDKLLQRLSAHIGYLTAENIELNIMIEDLREEVNSLKMTQDVNKHIEQMKQEDSPNE